MWCEGGVCVWREVQKDVSAWLWMRKENFRRILILYLSIKRSTSAIHFLVFWSKKRDKEREDNLPFCRSVTERVMGTEKFFSLRCSL